MFVRSRVALSLDESEDTQMIPVAGANTGRLSVSCVVPPSVVFARLAAQVRGFSAVLLPVLAPSVVSLSCLFSALAINDETKSISDIVAGSWPASGKLQ